MQLQEDKDGDEESKGDQVRMEIDNDLDNGRGQANAGAQAKKDRVLTLAEYEEQFETRYSQEVMTFLETVMTLDRMSDKNRFIEEFIFEVVRDSETSYLTPRNTTQIIT